MALPAGERRRPASRRRGAARAAAAKPATPILIVDDEAEIRDALADILKGARHRVVTATSGREALQRMAAAHYDVILTDIRMPDLDGRALYQAIERRWPGRAGARRVRHRRHAGVGLREFVDASGAPRDREAVHARRSAPRRRRGRERRAASRDAPLLPDDHRQGHNRNKNDAALKYACRIGPADCTCSGSAPHTITSRGVTCPNLTRQIHGASPRVRRVRPRRPSRRGSATLRTRKPYEPQVHGARRALAAAMAALTMGALVLLPCHRTVAHTLFEEKK